MENNTRKRGEVNILELDGAFCTGPGIETFHATIKNLLEHGEKNFLIDLGRVPTIDSSGLGTLARSYVSISNSGGKFKLLSPSKFVREMLAIVRLASLFEIYDEEQTAVASFLF